MKRLILFGLGVICLVVFAGAGTPRFKHPVEFTLAAVDTDPSLEPFTLASGLGGSMDLAGPLGLGVIEDPDWPYRTAIGFEALANNFTPFDHSTAGSFNTASGFRALYANYTGYSNTAVGFWALHNNYDGNSNTATGSAALFHNSSGTGNTANGDRALWSNTLGGGNTAIGNDTLFWNTIGTSNTAVGGGALNGNTTGNGNMAFGGGALYNNKTGERNTGIGGAALGENITGSWNTALGDRAGVGSTGGNYNIFIGAHYAYGIGVADDTNTIRIGSPYEPGHNPPAGQNRAFIAGIVETSLTAGDSPAVVGITGEGRLGSVPTSLLPKGDAGPQGPPGLQGLPGDGLVPGALLFLAQSATPPAGYAFLGTYDFSLTVAGSKKPTKLTVNVYQKQ